MNTSRHICTNKKRIFDTMFWLTFSNRFGCLGNVIRNYKDFPLFSECSTDISIKGNTIYFSFYTWKILDILKNVFPLRSNCIFELNFFLGEYCYDDEITCHATKENCRYWRVHRTNVSIFIQFPTSKFIQASKSLTNECECKEYIFKCTINSQVLIQSIGKSLMNFSSRFLQYIVKFVLIEIYCFFLIDNHQFFSWL